MTDIIDAIKKVETSMGRARPQTTSQQVDHQSDRLVTPRMSKAMTETKSEMEGRPYSPFGTPHAMAKSDPRQMPVEAIQEEVPPYRERL